MTQETGRQVCEHPKMLCVFSFMSKRKTHCIASVNLLPPFVSPKFLSFSTRNNDDYHEKTHAYLENVGSVTQKVIPKFVVSVTYGVFIV